MASCKIAVVMPSYERDLPYIPRCLDSIAAQTRQPDSVIICISGVVPDQIPKVAYNFPITWKMTSAHRNAAMNRNAGAELVGDDFDIVCFFDTDDEMMPHRLEYIERAFLSSDIDILVHNYVIIHSHKDDRTIKHKYFQLYTALGTDASKWGGTLTNAGTPIAAGCCTNGHVSIRAPLVKKYKYDERRIREEDVWFIRQMIADGHRVGYLHSQLSLYHCYKK